MRKLLIIILFSLLAINCGRNFTEEQKKYISSVEQMRDNTNKYMKDSPDSPFNAKAKEVFHPLKYYDVDPDFVFKSKLIEYPQKDTVKVFGTKGDERIAVRYGYVECNYNGNKFKANVYKGFARTTGDVYYSIWFTDKTTGKDTYGVGRYIDFELNPDPQFVYTIDFNLAYNPYCAYSPNYSCTIPTKEDFINLEIKAGEKSFH